MRIFRSNQDSRDKKIVELKGEVERLWMENAALVAENRRAREKIEAAQKVLGLGVTDEAEKAFDSYRGAAVSSRTTTGSKACPMPSHELTRR